MSPATDIASTRARYEAIFAPNWLRRTVVCGVIATMIAIYVGAFYYFDVPWARIIPGSRRRGS